jgi:hypothetical protein
MKIGLHTGPITILICLFFISVKWFLKYRMLKNHPHRGKQDTHARFFSNNSFGNASRETHQGILIAMQRHFECMRENEVGSSDKHDI